MNINDILVNLKVLEKVEINQKLISKGKFLNIEYDSIIPLSVRRWLRQDNRDEMLKKINIVISESIKLLKDENYEEFHNDLVDYLNKSINGLQNIKETYKYCSQTCAQIDVLIDIVKKYTI